MNDELIRKRLAERGEEAEGPIRLSFSSPEMRVEVEENTLRVVASTMGTADDRSGDVIFPGAYRSTIDGFLRHGFVAIGHQWDELPVAIPTRAEEVGRQMVCEAVFHSTQAAQDARTVCRERLEARKSVSVSVGILPNYANPDGVRWFENGTNLVAWAQGKGYDTRGWDLAEIKKFGFCRAITDLAEWFEWSLVGVGMNRGAKAVAAKSFADQTISGGGGSRFDLPFAEHLDSVLAAVEDVSSRIASYKAMRDRDGRPMSPDRVAQARRLAAALMGFMPDDATSAMREARVKAMFDRAGAIAQASK